MKDLIKEIKMHRFTYSYDDDFRKGYNGEFYPCKPDIFEQTYEKVNDKEVE